MTYIDYLNRFNRWLDSNSLPANSQLLYFKLLEIFNRAGWPQTVRVDNLRLMMMLNSRSEHTTIMARDRLVSAGFIRYTRGSKGKPNQYALLKIPLDFCSVFDSVNDSVNDSVFDSVNDSVSCRHIKTKTKTKNTTPKPPKGTDTGFDTFWQAYPKKAAKQNARKAWDKLGPDEGLLKDILAAVERDKQSDQWQRDGGQYIPYPATWLNGRRWEDEQDGEPEPEYSVISLLPDLEARAIPPDATEEDVWALVP